MKVVYPTIRDWAPSQEDTDPKQGSFRPGHSRIKKEPPQNES
jgi:hypothetical protein